MIIGNLLVSFLVDFLFGDLISKALADVMGTLVAWVTMPLEFAWGPALAVYFQGIALTIAIVVIFANGIVRGYLRNGGTQDMSSGAYIFRSLWPIALIAACPALMSAVTGLVASIIADATGGLATEEAFRGLVTVFESLLTASAASPLGMILIALCGTIITFYVVVVLYQCVKRQLQLAVLSVLAPLVAALTVADSTQTEFPSFLKEMLGVAIITVVQLSALMAALSVPQTLANMLAGDPSAIFVIPFLSAAIFAAVRQIPGWIERYTMLPGVGNSTTFSKSAISATWNAGRTAVSKLVGS